MCETINMGKNSFSVDVRFHHGGKFETNNKGKIGYVGGTISLKFGLCYDRLTYDSVIDNGRSFMNDKPFEAYFKLKGRSFTTGMQRLRHERGMIDFLNSRDKDDVLDLYFVEVSKDSNQVSPKTKNPSVSLNQQDESVTEASNEFIVSPISLRRSPRFTYTPNSIRRSPRFGISPILEPVRRLEKLPARRKLTEIFERQNKETTSEDLIMAEKQKGKQVVPEFDNAVDGEYDEDINNGYEEGGYEEGYWTEDSELSDYEIGNNEVGGDFVEDEELFTDVIDDSLIDAVNKNINQSCTKARETVRSRSHIHNVDDLNVQGLIDAMKVVVPKAEIRFCVRHIWANFKLQFSGQAFKESFWQAAWATTEVEFLAALEGIKFLSEPAYQYVKAIPPKHWSRHAFKTTCKSSMITNNLCESFNAVLKDARDKPILTHMEWMRRYIMKRNYEKREGVDKYEKPFMPYIDKCFKRVIAESRYCDIFSSIDTNFEVDYKGGSYTVNLVNQVCNCNHWALSGIPCIHAMACILQQRHIPEDYADQAYSKDKYLLAYTPAVNPMPGVTHWEKANQEEPLPPLMRRMPGRPSKKKRRKEPGEGSQVKRVKKANK
ncbi:uncharacterized protein LOC141605274 [Silene latifolia]|uniref:uncharacterized protein LOC141605274 n=1 Tax=Silene latifolia TaxID=37657 RepID=UPI003D787BAA